MEQTHPDRNRLRLRDQRLRGRRNLSDGPAAAEPAALTIRVLGSAAGGGLPQWNCRCAVCSLAWQGDPRVKPRTQSSIGLANRAGKWVLLNASPDLRQQILATPALAPRGAPDGAPGRDSPITAVVVTNADVDHVAGLLTLRESWPMRLYATGDVLEAIAANPVFRVLSERHVERIAVPLDQAFEPAEGVRLTLFAVPGKVALWNELGAGGGLVTDVADGRTVGVEIAGPQGHAFYIPGCARLSEALAARLTNARLLLFDGTLYADDEMIAAGLGEKTGRRMGHMPISGEGGSLAAFAALPIGRKVFIHLNNTNRALIEESAEHRAVRAAGWEIAEDGMEFSPWPN